MEQATNRKPKRERLPKKQTPSGKPKDTLTWAGCTGSLRQRKDVGFYTCTCSAGASVAGVFDALKTAEHNQNSAIQPEQETSHVGLFQVEPMPGVGVKVAVGTGVLVGVNVSVGVEVNVGVNVLVARPAKGPIPRVPRPRMPLPMARAMPNRMTSAPRKIHLRQAPSPPAPLPSTGEGGGTSPPAPLPSTGEGGGTSSPAPLPSTGEGGGTSPPAPLPSTGEGRGTSPPAPLPIASRGEGGRVAGEGGRAGIFSVIVGGTLRAGGRGVGLTVFVFCATSSSAFTSSPMLW